MRRGRGSTKSVRGLFSVADGVDSKPAEKQTRVNRAVPASSSYQLAKGVSSISCSSFSGDSASESEGVSPQKRAPAYKLAAQLRAQKRREEKRAAIMTHEGTSTRRVSTAVVVKMSGNVLRQPTPQKGVKEVDVVDLKSAGEFGEERPALNFLLEQEEQATRHHFPIEAASLHDHGVGEVQQTENGLEKVEIAGSPQTSDEALKTPTSAQSPSTPRKAGVSWGTFVQTPFLAAVASKDEVSSPSSSMVDFIASTVSASVAQRRHAVEEKRNQAQMQRTWYMTRKRARQVAEEEAETAKAKEKANLSMLELKVEELESALKRARTSVEQTKQNLLEMVTKFDGSIEALRREEEAAFKSAEEMEEEAKAEDRKVKRMEEEVDSMQEKLQSSVMELLRRQSTEWLQSS
eukprot:TRINITY_DN4626_c0_g1_i12.p1 TRINITY_DN4626_c0_g1~~TRINITY_DN4626_c0_g1_i12.p1  ORF type:complete len:405 (-),score=109.10 TRINITY_DN4626_c0_g1_i12:225-1439(-)